MTAPSRAREGSVGAAERDEPDQPRRASKVGTPLRTLALCLASLAVMAPWPLLGIMLTRSLFDTPSEAIGLFGGVTLFFLIPLAFVPGSDEVIPSIMLLVWCAMALIPDLALRRHLNSWWAVIGLLGIQTVFSFAQAVMGALLIIGKSV